MAVGAVIIVGIATDGGMTGWNVIDAGIAGGTIGAFAIGIGRL
jgi:hypothetical protein